jgi:hypothetical protein
MAAKLATTVHLTDDRGVAHTFGPDSDLPDWAEAHLAEAWPADREDLWEKAPSKASAKAAEKAPAK